MPNHTFLRTLGGFAVVAALLGACLDTKTFVEITDGPVLVFPVSGDYLAPDAEVVFYTGTTLAEKYDLLVDGSPVLSLDPPTEVGLVRVPNPAGLGTHTFQVRGVNSFQFSPTALNSATVTNDASTNYVFQGEVRDGQNNIPVGGADVTATDSNGNVVATGITDADGNYVLFISKTVTGDIKVTTSSEDYSSTSRYYQAGTHLRGLDLNVAQLATAQVTATSVATVSDPSGSVTVTVPGSVLKRADGQPVVFPVTVSVAYIDPKTNIEAMPGIDMLSEDPATGALKPLTSVGAAILAGSDATGAEVRVDQDAAEASQTPVSLSFDTDKLQVGNTGALPEGVKTWVIDPSNTNSETWVETPTLEVTDGPFGDLLRVSDPGWIRKYARDYAAAYNAGQLDGAIVACSGSLQLNVEELIVDESKTDAELLAALLPLMLNSAPSADALCNASIEALKNDTYTPFGDAFNIRFSSFWMTQSDDRIGSGKWTCAPSTTFWGQNLRQVPTLFLPDLRQVVEEQDKICAAAAAAAAAAEWTNASKVDYVDLVPFNLDVPWSGTPIEFQMNEPNGDGRYQFVLTASSPRGEFGVSKVFNAPGVTAKAQVLVPENTNVLVRIYAEFEADKSVLMKDYVVGSATATFRWDGGKGNIGTTTGPVNWQILDRFSF